MPVNFDDLTNRILDKLDKIEASLDNLCDRTTKNEYTIESHLNDVEKDNKNKEKKTYLVIAIIGVVFGVIEILQLVN